MAPSTVLRRLTVGVALIVALAACSSTTGPTVAPTTSPTATSTAVSTASAPATATPVAPTPIATPDITRHMTKGEATISFAVDGIGTLTNPAPLTLEQVAKKSAIFPGGAMYMDWELTVGDTIPAELYLYFQTDPSGTTLVTAGQPDFTYNNGFLDSIPLAPTVWAQISGNIGAVDYLQVFDTKGSGEEATFPVPQPPCTVTTASTATGGVSGTVTCSATYTSYFDPNSGVISTHPYTMKATFWAEP